MLVLKSAPFFPEMAVAAESEVLVEAVVLFLQALHKNIRAANASEDRYRIIVPFYSKMGANRQLVAR
jgi:hypothetical protein